MSPAAVATSARKPLVLELGGLIAVHAVREQAIEASREQVEKEQEVKVGAGKEVSSWPRWAVKVARCWSWRQRKNASKSKWLHASGGIEAAKAASG